MLVKRKARSAWRVTVVVTAVLFAVMPAVSSAMAMSAGAFSRVFLHIHAVEDTDHVHRAAHQHDHEHDDGGASHHHHDEPASDEMQGGGSDILHVHHEVGYPSVMLPAAMVPQVTVRLAARLRVPGSHEPPSELRDRLLRPPIALF